MVQFGAVTRGSQSLVLASKARAILMGRSSVSKEDIRALAVPVLKHRMILTFKAEADGLTQDEILLRLLDEKE